MARYLISRAIGSIPVIVLISFLVFALLQGAPGDPAALLLSADYATPEDIAEVRRLWGLDEPMPVQYYYFLRRAVLGDLGDSFKYNTPVKELIAQRLPATIELAAFTVVIACLIAIPIGVLAGTRPNSAIDNIGTIFGLTGVSMPYFWLGIMIILLFAGNLHILPAAGRASFGVTRESITGFYFVDSVLRWDWWAFWDALRHVLGPALAMGLTSAGILMRITRSAVLEVMREDYVMVARAKGLANRVVLWRHVLRNAQIPIITVFGLELGTLLSGAIVTETVFAWPGVGSLLIEAISARDYPLVTGLVLMYSVGFILINLAVDVAYARADPRIRY